MAQVHERLFDEPQESTVAIETTADVIKPPIAYASKLVDEMKIRFDSDRMWFDVVDPANVSMLGVDIPREAFESYDVDETVIGVNVSSLNSALRAGRQRKGDPVSINMPLSHQRLKTSIDREYSGTEMSLQDSMRLIDPDSIRQEPEVPELELETTATVPRKAFKEALMQVNERGNAFRLESVDTDLRIQKPFAEDEDNGGAVVRDVVEGEVAGTNFSLDYTKDALKGFASLGADELTLHYGEDLPLKITFTVELNGVECEGYWFQAPRITSE